MRYRDIQTPAFVLDEQRLEETMVTVSRAVQESNGRVLYALKALTLPDVLRVVERYVDGFATSSLNEARLARDLIGGKGTIHMTTPSFRTDEIEEIVEICDYVTFNSLSQWERFRGSAFGRSRCGLRINPQLPLLKDDRYNPCRPHSKLGVPLKDLTTLSEKDLVLLAGISGLHFHSNCESSDVRGLLSTVQHLDKSISPLLDRIEWINLGGGYLFEEADDLGPFHEAVGLLRGKYALQVFIEPGAAIVRKAASLVSMVLDIIESDGKKIAVLDTTVNHMPEVFEYQYAPEVMGDCEDGEYEYILAGCSCLAGDLFGDYAFAEPLEVGSRVVFANVGAYTLVKAHMFNGINLPTIYTLKEDGTLVMVKRFTYEDFANRCGVDIRVLI